MNETSDERLRAEAVAFTRYLLGAEPAPELIERYAAANRRLFPEAVSPRERRLIDAGLRRPWMLPFLDAAEALLNRKSLLHNKILLMAAILETTTQHAARFVPLPLGTPRLILELGLLGCASGFRCIGGLILRPFVRESQG